MLFITGQRSDKSAINTIDFGNHAKVISLRDVSPTIFVMMEQTTTGELGC
jgi:hypothetical protein